MRNQSTLGPRATLLIRFYVGVGWIILGAATMVGAHPAYPANDQRSGPFFWPEIGLATLVAGAIILAFAIRDLRRKRRPKADSSQSDSGDIAAR